MNSEITRRRAKELTFRVALCGLPASLPLPRTAVVISSRAAAANSRQLLTVCVGWNKVRPVLIPPAAAALPAPGGGSRPAGSVLKRAHSHGRSPRSRRFSPPPSFAQLEALRNTLRRACSIARRRTHDAATVLNPGTLQVLPHNLRPDKSQAPQLNICPGKVQKGSSNENPPTQHLEEDSG